MSVPVEYTPEKVNRLVNSYMKHMGKGWVAAAESLISRKKRRSNTIKKIKKGDRQVLEKEIFMRLNNGKNGNDGRSMLEKIACDAMEWCKHKQTYNTIYDIINAAINGATFIFGNISIIIPALIMWFLSLPGLNKLRDRVNRSLDQACNC